MDFRVMDEAVVFEGRGITLVISEGDQLPFNDGCCIRDARGSIHIVDRVTHQEDLTCLYLRNADPTYFERLLRNVMIDATLFTLLPGDA